MSSQESSGSSGSSRQSSGLRALGLYRSMDARTEEFLRLSRKRQLRRGCACAAASTAITVTLVIVVFFVYEFSLNSNSQLEKSLKYKWLTLINDTEDGTSFDPKVTKANIDKTTLKLLPLLIKAIKKNAALEKLFEDQPNTLSSDIRRDKKKDHASSEENVKTNDWLSKPTTHLFAVDHKTLPIIFYRDPTKNIELYTKIRKIRDYQRVFKYVDKMINDKVYVRSTKPMQPEPAYLPATTPTSTQHNKRVNTSDKAESKNTTNMKHTCKCFHHFKELLYKILKQYETILPQIKQYNMKAMQTDCRKHMDKNVSPTIKSDFADLSSPLPTYSSSPRSIQTVAVPPQKVNIFLSVDDNIEREDLQLKESKPLSESKNKLTKNYLRYIKSLIDTQPIKPKVVAKFHDIINKTQISKRQDIKLNKIEPVFDGLEYDDYYYTVPTTKKSGNIDYINYMKTKRNYLKDIYVENAKKRAFNKIKSFTTAALRNATDVDMKVTDNKITLIKAKQKLKCNNDCPNKNNTASLKDIGGDEKQIISNLFNSSAVIEKYFKNNLVNNYFTDIPVQLEDNKKNQYESKSAYFKYSTGTQEDKTIHDILKNTVNSYISNKSSRSYSTPPLNMISDQEQSKTTMQPLTYIIKTNKSSTYRIIENHVNALLHKNISALKTLKQKYYSVVPIEQNINRDQYETNKQDRNKDSVVTPFTNEIHTNSMITTTPTSHLWTQFHITSQQTRSSFEKPVKDRAQNIHSKNPNKLHKEQRSSTVDPNESLTEESDLLITEITKSPQNVLHQSSFNLTEKEINSDLTWEDLTNEFMPAWRSMIQDPNKPIYLGFQTSDDKIEDQEDYNINSNFYDLNL